MFIFNHHDMRILLRVVVVEKIVLVESWELQKAKNHFQISHGRVHRSLAYDVLLPG